MEKRSIRDILCVSNDIEFDMLQEENEEEEEKALFFFSVFIFGWILGNGV